MTGFSKDKALSLLQDGDGFVVELTEETLGWIGRRKQHAIKTLSEVFIEGYDFTRKPCKTGGMGRTAISYYLTVSCYKQLAMLSKTTEGRAVREFFIDAEEQLRVIKGAAYSSSDLAEIKIGITTLTEIVTTQQQQLNQFAPLVANYLGLRAHTDNLNSGFSEFKPLLNFLESTSPAELLKLSKNQWTLKERTIQAGYAHLWAEASFRAILINKFKINVGPAVNIGASGSTNVFDDRFYAYGFLPALDQSIEDYNARKHLGSKATQEARKFLKSRRDS